jgi:hypothetical protein
MESETYLEQKMTSPGYLAVQLLIQILNFALQTFCPPVKGNIAGSGEVRIIKIAILRLAVVAIFKAWCLKYNFLSLSTYDFKAVFYQCRFAVRITADTVLQPRRRSFRSKYTE